MKLLDKLSTVAPPAGRRCFALFLSAVAGVLLFNAVTATESTTTGYDGIVEIDLAAFHHIQFDDLKANDVAIGQDRIVFDVDSSTSFVMQGFAEVRSVRSVSLLWQATGRPPLADAGQEASKKGDDAVVKLALMIEGEPSGFGWFLPDWIKQVRSHLQHASNEMIYLVADARHAPGEAWPNPYNEDISMIAMSNAGTNDGAVLSTASFDQPLRVVGIWLMADGDNTESGFRTTVKRVTLVSPGS